MTGEKSQMRRTLKSNSLGWRCPLWTSHTLPLAARTPSHIHARVTQAQTHLSVGSKTKKEACFSCQEWRETGRRMERWGGDYNLIRGRKSCQIPLKEPKCLWATGYWTPPERSSLVQKTETTGNEANNRQKKRGHNPLNYSDCKKKKKNSISIQSSETWWGEGGVNPGQFTGPYQGHMYTQTTITPTYSHTNGQFKVSDKPSSHYLRLYIFVRVPELGGRTLKQNELNKTHFCLMEGILSCSGLDCLVGQIGPTGHQLMITGLGTRER